MSRVLVVDDEASICWAFRESLADEGHEVDVAASAEEGLRIAARTPPDAVVLDVRLPGMDGLTAMGAFRDRIGPTPIVIMTAFGDLETAVRAMDGGSFDYLVKPFDLDQATLVVKRALERQHARGARLRATEPAGPDPLVGTSPAMQGLFRSIALVASSDVPVLITGESGTGKELVARAIHRHSRRHAGPFLPICLAALSPGLVEGEIFGHVKGSFTGATQDRRGLFELAGGGTVLLDEVGDIPLPLQVKMLRAIEHREVTPVGDAHARPTDIRVIAATNRNLAELMAGGQFREDLFFRLGVFQIHTPPLRERRDDIPALAEHFLRRSHPPARVETHLTPAAIAELRSRPWKGNIRELRNTIEHAAIVARGQPIRPEHLPAASGPAVEPSSSRGIEEAIALWSRQVARPDDADPGAGSVYEQFLGLVEPPLLRAILDQAHGNRAAAAQHLGIHRATLREKIRRYKI